MKQNFFGNLFCNKKSVYLKPFLCFCPVFVQNQLWNHEIPWNICTNPSDYPCRIWKRTWRETWAGILRRLCWLCWTCPASMRPGSFRRQWRVLGRMSRCWSRFSAHETIRLGHPGSFYAWPSLSSGAKSSPKAYPREGEEGSDQFPWMKCLYSPVAVAIWVPYWGWNSCRS